MTDIIKDVDRVVWQTAIKALNDLHQKHGIDDVMKCNVCTSQTAEMTIARHFQKLIDEMKTEHLKEINKSLIPSVKELKQNIMIRANTEKIDKERIQKLQLALNKIAWISKHPVEG